ncbi:MAG: hypothetical protein RIC14_13720 [Filomicrobium sp.]
MTRLAQRLFVLLLFAALPIQLVAQERSPLDPVPFPDGSTARESKSIVIVTRLVDTTKTESGNPANLFQNHRIATELFNATDHCVDEGTLIVADDYFRTLGRMLEKNGFYFFIPKPEVEKLKMTCTARNEAEVKALASDSVRIVAFGRILPTEAAHDLEKKLR